MILSRKALTLAEVKSYLSGNPDERKQLDEYLKKFSKITKDKAEKLKEEIRLLNNPKITEESIVKIVDFMPEDLVDLNKIFNEVSLSEEESKAIIEIVKKYC